MDAAELLERYAAGVRNFRGAILRETDLHEAELPLADLREADLSEAILCGADLSQANLSRATLAEAHLEGACLYRANLELSSLRAAVLESADMSLANLNRADLSDANLESATLLGTALCEANLKRANLFAADLSGASLCAADLSGANLRAVLFEDTDLTDAIITPGTDCDIAQVLGDWTVLGDGPIISLDYYRKVTRRHANAPERSRRILETVSRLLPFGVVSFATATLDPGSPGSSPVAAALVAAAALGSLGLFLHAIRANSSDPAP